MRGIKYQLICGFLSVGILTSGCSHKHHTQECPQEHRALSTFTVGLGNYSKEPTPSASTSNTSVASEDGLGKILGTILGFLLVGAAIKASSSYAGASPDMATSDMTEIERKAGRYLTKSGYEQYYNEHPETWTPVYIIPSE